MRKIIAISIIFALAILPMSSSMCQTMPWDEFGMTEEEYIDLTNRIDLAISELISRDVRIDPAEQVKNIEVIVGKILNANIVKMGVIEISNLFAQATVGKTDIEISAIYTASIVNSTTEQLPKILAAIFANATQTQVEATFAKALAQAPDTTVAEILKACVVSGVEIHVSAVMDALFASKTEVEIRRIFAAAYVSRTGIDFLDYLDAGGNRWIIMRMKAAKSVGNEELYQELKMQLLRSITDWNNNPRVDRKVNLVDPEL